MVNFEKEFKAVEGQWDFDPETKHHFSNGLYAKEMNMPSGYIAYSHSHEYSHLSILAKGRVIVKTEAYN